MNKSLGKLVGFFCSLHLLVLNWMWGTPRVVACPAAFMRVMFLHSLRETELRGEEGCLTPIILQNFCSLTFLKWLSLDVLVLSLSCPQKKITSWSSLILMESLSALLEDQASRYCPLPPKESQCLWWISIKSGNIMIHMFLFSINLYSRIIRSVGVFVGILPVGLGAFLPVLGTRFLLLGCFIQS